MRSNWIEGGNRQLDLVEADSAAVINHPDYRTTFVHGNVLIEPDGAGNSQILHYGGDGGDPADYRKGTLHFYNNTVVSTRSGNTTLQRLSTNDESSDARNNILYVTAEGGRLAMLDASGNLTLRNNWTKPGWVDSHGTLLGTVDDDGSGVVGASPGFVDEGAQDFHLEADSDAVDTGTILHPDVLPDHPLDRQYVKHLLDEPRPAAGPSGSLAPDSAARGCGLGRSPGRGGRRLAPRSTPRAGMRRCRRRARPAVRRARSRRPAATRRGVAQVRALLEVGQRS